MARKTITVQADLFKIPDSLFGNNGPVTLRPILQYKQCRCGRLCTSNYITSDDCPVCGCSPQIPVFFDVEVTEVD